MTGRGVVLASRNAHVLCVVGRVVGLACEWRNWGNVVMLQLLQNREVGMEFGRCVALVFQIMGDLCYNSVLACSSQTYI